MKRKRFGYMGIKKVAGCLVCVTKALFSVKVRFGVGFYVHLSVSQLTRSKRNIAQALLKVSKAQLLELLKSARQVLGGEGRQRLRRPRPGQEVAMTGTSRGADSEKLKKWAGGGAGGGAPA